MKLFALLLPLITWLILPNSAFSQSNSNPIVIGLNADMSGGSAQAGEAILRGMQVATAEINEAGGVLGRTLEIRVADHKAK